jgi:hypothetical protein
LCTPSGNCTSDNLAIYTPLKIYAIRDEDKDTLLKAFKFEVAQVEAHFAKTVEMGSPHDTTPDAKRKAADNQTFSSPGWSSPPRRLRISKTDDAAKAGLGLQKPPSAWGGSSRNWFQGRVSRLGWFCWTPRKRQPFEKLEDWGCHEGQAGFAKGAVSLRLLQRQLISRSLFAPRLILLDASQATAAWKSRRLRTPRKPALVCKSRRQLEAVAAAIDFKFPFRASDDIAGRLASDIWLRVAEHWQMPRLRFAPWMSTSSLSFVHAVAERWGCDLKLQNALPSMTTLAINDAAAYRTNYFSDW